MANLLQEPNIPSEFGIHLSVNIMMWTSVHQLKKQITNKSQMGFKGT